VVIGRLSDEGKDFFNTGEADRKEYVSVGHIEVAHPDTLIKGIVCVGTERGIPLRQFVEKSLDVFGRLRIRLEHRCVFLAKSEVHLGGLLDRPMRLRPDRQIKTHSKISLWVDRYSGLRRKSYGYTMA
jgi:hypothetical protein